MSSPADEELIEVLQDARALLRLPDNEFIWSGWKDADEAVAEIDGYIEQLRRGDHSSKNRMEMVFAPTGSLQETSEASGWPDEYFELSCRFDEAVEKLPG